MAAASFTCICSQGDIDVSKERAEAANVDLCVCIYMYGLYLVKLFQCKIYSLLIPAHTAFHLLMCVCVFFHDQDQIWAGGLAFKDKSTCHISHTHTWTHTQDGHTQVWTINLIHLDLLRNWLLWHVHLFLETSAKSFLSLCLFHIHTNTPQSVGWISVAKVLRHIQRKWDFSPKTAN